MAQVPQITKYIQIISNYIEKNMSPLHRSNMFQHSHTDMTWEQWLKTGRGKCQTWGRSPSREVQNEDRDKSFHLGTWVKKTSDSKHRMRICFCNCSFLRCYNTFWWDIKIMDLFNCSSFLGTIFKHYRKPLYQCFPRPSKKILSIKDAYDSASMAPRFSHWIDI